MKQTFSAAFFLVFSAISFSSKAQQIAFPGAEGAGKYTVGGRGTISTATTVYEVTTLDDTNTPGTLRYALSNGSSSISRTIIFRISGTIRLVSPLSIRANTTVAGQTAPGDGICIADYPVSLSGDNIIVRYMRFRLGDKNQQARLGNDDALTATSRSNLIIDHCSLSWSNDEVLSSYETNNVTVQWNIMSEPLNFSYHNEGSGIEHHAYGGIWGGRNASFHHNLLAHLKGRTPRFDGSRNLPNSSSPVVGSENADFRNNVIYNWSDYTVNGGEGGNYNVVNNYYKYGPNTPNSSTSGVNRRYMVLNPFKQSSPALPYGKYFMQGNYVDGSTTITDANWKGAAMNGGSLADTNQAKVTTPFVFESVSTQSAIDAYELVLAKAGASVRRDTLDQRIVKDVRNRTGKIIDVQGGYPAGTPFATSQTAWPSLASLPAPADTDHDGMPDSWESRRGLNPNSATDRGVFNVNGYTNLENYLNGDSITAIGTTNTCINTKAVTVTNSSGWTHAFDSTYSIVNAMDTTNLVASILNNGNFGTFNVSYYVTNTTRLSAYSSPYLNRNVTITPVNASLITSPVTVRLYITVAELNALKAADPSIVTISDLRIFKAESNTCQTALTGFPERITPTASGVFGTYQNGYYLEFNTASFSTFYIAGSNAVLPLKLISFNAAYDGKNAKLNWSTVNETNTKAFEIQRSSNGVDFMYAGKVNARASSSVNSYTFEEAIGFSNKIFYRLKMIDKNGSFTYSSIAMLNSRSNSVLQINPNPAISTIGLSHPKAERKAVVKIVSADGKVVMESNIDVNSQYTQLDISALAKGTYMIVYQHGSKSITAKFLKQ